MNSSEQKAESWACLARTKYPSLVQTGAALPSIITHIHQRRTCQFIGPLLLQPGQGPLILAQGFIALCGKEGAKGRTTS